MGVLQPKEAILAPANQRSFCLLLHSACVRVFPVFQGPQVLLRTF